VTPGHWGAVSGALDAASFALMARPAAWPGKGRRRQAQPRLAWLLWAGLYQVMFWSSAAAGARGSLWLPGVEAAGTLGMCALALTWGSGTLAVIRVTWHGRPSVTVPDRAGLLVLLGAVAALAGWAAAASPAAGVALSVATDCLASVPLVRAAWREPWNCSRVAWAVTGLASVAAIPSVAPGQAAVLYAYPVTGACLDTVIVAVLLAASRRQAGTAGQPAPPAGRGAGGRWPGEVNPSAPA
jgi:hypothetical protein